VPATESFREREDDLRLLIASVSLDNPEDALDPKDALERIGGLVALCSGS